MAKRFVYTDEHIEFLRAGYQQMSVIKLTEAFNARFNFNKSRDTIKATLTNHGIKCGRGTGELMKGKPKVFTPEQKEWFIKNYPLFTRKELTIEFNRAFNENRKMSQVVAFLKNNKIKSGRTGYFKKGQASWSKGTKGVLKANSGSFKKDQTAHNWMPVGRERIVEGGYIEVKVAEPHQWVAKHRILWEETHGPIPEKHKVRFKDGNPANITIDNLFLVNHAEHQHLNNLDYKNHADEHKDTVLLIARVRSKTNEVLRNG